MKTLIALMICVAGSLAVATQTNQKATAKQSCCAEKKMEAKQEAKQGCCGEKKTEAKQEAKQGCGTKVCAEDEFMAEAERMMQTAEGKQACCKSTAQKPMAKGDKGCCNAKGEAAKFKVFVAGEGYKYFGCEGSAGKGRKELIASGKKVGNVQKVNGKVAMR